MSDKFSKILRIIEKTGDRCIVFEKETDEAYVVMSLDQYENASQGQNDIGRLTEDELLNKINSDIALWKRTQETSPQKERDSEETFNTPLTTVESVISSKAHEEKPTESDERYYFEPVEKDE